MNAQDIKIWNESEKQIDSRIASFLSEREWDSLLPKGLNNEDRMKAYYSHIMYVINSFLEEDDTRELYIQIPVEEFANKDSNGGDDKQIKRFRWLNGTIAACLQMATIEHLKKGLFVPNDVDYENTLKWYGTGDLFLVNKKRGGNFYAEVISNGNNSRLKFYDSLKYFSPNKGVQGNPRQAFDECDHNSFVKIKSIPPQVKKGLKQIHEVIKMVQNTPAILKQYYSAALVSIGSFSPLNEHLASNCQYINTPVDFFSNYHQTTDYEIIIINGDKQYKETAQAYRNSNARKIIYMGSEPPFDGNIKTYPFSFREVYRYCSSFFQFKEPDIVTLSFPWLDERKKELYKLLLECCQTDDYFTEEDVANVERKLLCYFSRYDFDTTQLERVKTEFNENNIEGKLNLHIDISDETIERILNWIQSLTFDDINPKMQWLKEKNFKAPLILGKNHQHIQKRICQLYGYENVIIADNLAICSWDNRYQTILRYHLFAKIIALYYTNEGHASRTLLNYMNNEYECYTDGQRQFFCTNINEFSHPNHEVLPVWLDHFFEEEYWVNESIYGQSERYRVSFEDGTSDIIDGDVIVNLAKDGYDDINIRDAKIGMNISYYKRPAIFENLIAVCEKHRIRWSQIIKYSKLWKQKLIDVYNSKLGNGHSKEIIIKDISAKSGLPKERIKTYCKENTNRFLGSPKEMKNILNYLASMQMISDEDKKEIIKARYYNSQIPLEFGGELKKELYDFFLNDKFNSSFLEGISKNSGLSINEIFSSAIVSNKVIKTIKILNKND